MLNGRLGGKPQSVFGNAEAGVEYIRLATSDGNAIRSEFVVQVEVEKKTFLGTKTHSVSYPIKIL